MGNSMRLCGNILIDVIVTILKIFFTYSPTYQGFEISKALVISKQQI